MDPQAIFCPNLECPARGRTASDPDHPNQLHVHARDPVTQQPLRYRCSVCGVTFSATKGTALYRLHKSEELFVTVVTLCAYGCPCQAIVAAYGLDERTVAAWQERAGRQTQALHEHLVLSPRDLGEVQADEIWVKQQGQRLWLALALAVKTRLWLGGAVDRWRHGDLILRLLRQVAGAALCRPLLLCVDGYQAYVGAVRKAFRVPQPGPTPRARHGGHGAGSQGGRRRLLLWPVVRLAQVIKVRQGEAGEAGKEGKPGRGVVAIVRRVVMGTAQEVEAVRHKVTAAAAAAGGGGNGVLNTAFIERLNATFRARWAPLARRTRALGRQAARLEWGMYLVGTLYNFCHEHASLRRPGLVAARGRGPAPGAHRWLERTPAMAAGITDHCWSVAEVMRYGVPPPPWQPPPRGPGRPPRAVRELAARWAS